MTANAFEIVLNLDAEAIRARLRQLEEEESGLRVLLRSAVARERARRRAAPRACHVENAPASCA